MVSIHPYHLQDAGPALPEPLPLPIGAIAVGLVNLLQEAASLPAPIHISVFDTEHIMLQFTPARASLKTITRWALRFGAVVVSEPQQGNSGPEIWCRAEFGYHGVAITAFAHIPVTATGTPQGQQPGHVDYPHQPGRLYDCPACEAACHCTPGDAECVYSGQHNGLAET